MGTDSQALSRGRMRAARKSLRGLSNASRAKLANAIPSNVKLAASPLAQAALQTNPLALLRGRVPGAKRLGRGAYGAAYALDCPSKLLSEWRDSARHRIDGKPLPATGKAVVKLSTRSSYDRDLEREAAFYNHVFSSEGSLFGKHYKGRCAVPTFFFAGSIPLKGGKSVYVIVYGMVEGKSLMQLFKQNSIVTSEMRRAARALRETLRALVACNVMHADAHGGNFIWDGTRVYAIDFGFAVWIPEKVIGPFRQTPSNMDTLYSAARPAVNRVIVARGYSRYNPNVALFDEMKL